LRLAVGGTVALGAGGASTAVAAALATRWFDARRGLVLGIAGGGMAAGQLLIVPLAMWLTLGWGWRVAFVVIGAGFLAGMLPLILGLIRNDPAEKSLRPFGAGGAGAVTAAQPGVERTTL